MENRDPKFWDLLAIEAYRSILKAKPESSLVHFYLGLAYTRINRNNKAIRSFLRAIKYDNKASTPYYHLGKAYLKEGKVKDGVRYLKRYQKAAFLKHTGKSPVVEALMRETRKLT
jgi:tetratricopeptide (TPR) repeat protein